MSKTKSEIQFEALSAIQMNGWTGTCILDTGTGKTKLGLDIIVAYKRKKVLILKPAITLSYSWEQQIKEWLIVTNSSNNNYSCATDYGIMDIKVENIQTAYKWSEEQIAEYDYIILDEVHTMVTDIYGQLLEKANKLNIEILGLTATPDDNKPEKAALYNKYCPIIFKYQESAKDGLINNRRYVVIEYDLSTTEMVTAGTKANPFLKSEFDQNMYINSAIDKVSAEIRKHYYKYAKSNFITFLGDMSKTPFPSLDKNQLRAIQYTFTPPDNIEPLEHFFAASYTICNNDWTLRPVMEYIKGVKYYALGTKVLENMRLVDNLPAAKEIKGMFMKFWRLIQARKEFLWSLPSSAKLAIAVKNRILNANANNKVLIFSARKPQSKLISNNHINGEMKTELVTKIMSDFNEGHIRDLASVDKIRMGINFKNVKYGIIESYNGSTVDHNQKVGRTDRLDVEDIAVIIILLPRNTRANEWFLKAIDVAKNKGYSIEYISNLDELIL